MPTIGPHADLEGGVRSRLVTELGPLTLRTNLASPMYYELWKKQHNFWAMQVTAERREREAQGSFMPYAREFPWHNTFTSAKTPKIPELPCWFLELIMIFGDFVHFLKCLLIVKQPHWAKRESGNYWNISLLKMEPWKQNKKLFDEDRFALNRPRTMVNFEMKPQHKLWLHVKDKAEFSVGLVYTWMRGITNHHHP